MNGSPSLVNTSSQLPLGSGVSSPLFVPPRLLGCCAGVNLVHPTQSLSLGLPQMSLRNSEDGSLSQSNEHLCPSCLPWPGLAAGARQPGPGEKQDRQGLRRGAYLLDCLFFPFSLLLLPLPPQHPSGVGGKPGLELKRKPDQIGTFSHAKVGAAVAERMLQNTTSPLEVL